MVSFYTATLGWFHAQESSSSIAKSNTLESTQQDGVHMPEAHLCASTAAVGEPAEREEVGSMVTAVDDVRSLDCRIEEQVIVQEQVILRSRS